MCPITVDALSAATDRPDAPVRGVAVDPAHASRLAARLGRAKLALGDAVGPVELSDGLRARRCSWPPL